MTCKLTYMSSSMMISKYSLQVSFQFFRVQWVILVLFIRKYLERKKRNQEGNTYAYLKANKSTSFSTQWRNAVNEDFLS